MKNGLSILYKLVVGILIVLLLLPLAVLMAPFYCLYEIGNSALTGATCRGARRP